MNDWLIGLFSFGGLGLLIVLAEWFRRYQHWPAEVTRKFTHISVGLLVAAVAPLIHSPLPPLTLGLLFTVSDFLAVRFNLLKGIHDTGRKSYGTVFYPLAFTLLVFFFWSSHRPVVVIAMLVLSLADAAAALTGSTVKRPRHYRLASEMKTVQGSIAMGIVTFLVVGGGFYYFQNYVAENLEIEQIIVWSAALSLLAVAVEAISWRGSDNITVPLTVAAVADVFLFGGQALSNQLLTGLTLAAIVSFVSYRLRFLTLGGAVAGWLVGTMVFGFGGWPFALPLLVFFVTSSVLSKIGKSGKMKLEDVFEKGNQRDAGQVLANGGAAALFAVVAMFDRSGPWFTVFLGTIAAVTADTWSTEIGVFRGGRPRNVLTWRVMDVGSSGAISIAGTLGGALGALCIAASAITFYEPEARMMTMIFVIMVAGLAGALVDSLLGASVQAQYVCNTCGRVTERQSHCMGENTRVRGRAFFNNDVVNVFCSFGGAAVALAFCLLLEN